MAGCQTDFSIQPSPNAQDPPLGGTGADPASVCGRTIPAPTVETIHPPAPKRAYADPVARRVAS